MSNDSDKPDDRKIEPAEFSEIDDLLDRAMSLSGSMRDEFLDQLEPRLRSRVCRLLELTEAITLERLSSRAATTLDRLASGQAETTETPTGRWRLEHEIGTGGMGQVFYATREETGGDGASSGYVQRAAVKVLWSQRPDEEVRARFYRERRILASLDHPGIARFLDGGFLSDGRPWFAMEFVDGTNVMEYARSRDLKQRLELFIEICSAVSYAHERLIVHRDIKPQNVLVDSSGRPRLLDFGVASIVDDSDEGLTRTTGSPLTLQYASPEQVTGKLTTVASDIYQLGLLLYELLTGRAAYDLRDRPLQEAIRIIDEVIPPPPSQIGSALGRDLDAIVMMALDKEPSDRYRSAMALADDVKRYLEGRPVVAVPHSRWYVARRFVRRNFLIVSIVGASIAALAVATAVSWHLALEARDEARRSAATQEILGDVFRKADPFGDGAANITLADALVKAQPGISQRVADDPVLARDVNRTLAEIYESLGLVEHEAAAYQDVMRAAEQIHDQQGFRRLVGVAGYGGTLARTNPADAIEWFAAELPDQPHDAKEAGPWLSGQYSYVGALDRLRQFEAAAEQALKMQAVVERLDITTPRIRGRLSQQLANVARRRGDTDGEDRHWQNAVDFMRQANAPSALAVTLNNRAIFLGRNKRYQESEAAFLEAIGLFEAAEHEDASLAGVLRGYAGLQFRMGNRQEAILTTRRALGILDAPDEAYARFVAQLNLVRYLIVTGDMDELLNVMIPALVDAVQEFEAASGVPERMLEVFAKTLLFGGQRDQAATSLGISADCRDDEALFRVIQPMEDPAEQDARESIWAAVSEMRMRAEQESLRQQDLDHVVAVYQDYQPPFFDVLDHWRVLDALDQAAIALRLPNEISSEHDRLAVLMASTRSALSTRYAPEIAELAAWFNTSWVSPNPCLP